MVFQKQNLMSCKFKVNQGPTLKFLPVKPVCFHTTRTGPQIYHSPPLPKSTAFSPASIGTSTCV